MSFFEKPRNQIVTAVLLVALLIAAAIVIYRVNSIDLPESGGVRGDSGGYTLFGIGGNSVFSKQTRGALVKKLGGDRIDDWSPVDFVDKGAPFIGKSVPDLVELNRRLNYDGGARAGMATIKVSYRYARSRKLPFDSVRVVFSNFSKRPLFIKARLKREGASFVDLLMGRHGEPRVENRDAGGTRYIWENSGEFLFINMNRDRQGRPEYRVSIYFMDNIRDLTGKVEEEREKDEERRKGVEESAIR